VNGKVYQFARDSAYTGLRPDAKFKNSDGDFKTMTQSDAEDLQAGGDVTLYLDQKGDLIYVTGVTESSATSVQTAILSAKLESQVDFGDTSNST